MVPVKSLLLPNPILSEQKLPTAAMDRISSLPDDILIHILSSVHTKQAVATSILSKRWIHLWLYVSVLEFRSKDGESLSHFEKFVFFVLRSREAAGNHSIYKFILHSKSHSSRLQSLLFGNSSKLRTCILACTNLVVLKLRWFWFFLDGHDSLYNFPALKTLHLKDIFFDQRRELMMLLDACPVLEDLQLSDTYMNSYTHHSLDYFASSSMLRKLNRADITDCECYFLVKSLSNLEFLRIQLSKAYHRYEFLTFHNLTHLMLNYDWDIVVQVLHHCPKLQNLELYQKLQGDNEQDKYITRDYMHNWADPKSVPTCLLLNLTTCTMRDFAYAGNNVITLC